MQDKSKTDLYKEDKQIGERLKISLKGEAFIYVRSFNDYYDLLQNSIMIHF